MSATASSPGEAKVAHHFVNIQQQRDSAILGMWVFLVTEIMFFGALFAVYIIYRYMYPETYHHFSREMDLRLGTLNTGVLLTSSLTMALAVHAAKVANRRALVALLSFTTLAGVIFMIVKGFEWHHKWEHGMVPGLHWTYAAADSYKAQAFYQIYFVMTGLHGLHVLIGMGILAVFAVMAQRGKFLGENYMAIEVLGLYWHFVDLVWIYLFPLFYLIDRS